TIVFFFFSSRRRHTRFSRDWSSDVCSSDLNAYGMASESTTTARLRESVAEEIRVLLARRRRSASELARQIGVTQPYISRRLTGRSEERRVGKECRCRGATEREVKKRKAKMT